jgi:NAD(P)-dependent dehydrogenase (short-subunit alcohol dehydrogenase family)
MQQAEGHIINISSLVGAQGGKDRRITSIKGGSHRLTVSAVNSAVNIKVNDVLPGYIPTKMSGVSHLSPGTDTCENALRRVSIL